METFLSMFSTDNTGKVYFGREASRRKRAMREASEIIAGKRRLIDSHYIWHWILIVAAGSGVFMFSAGWVVSRLFYLIY